MKPVANRRSDLLEWLTFVSEESHVLLARPSLLFQQAANRPASTHPAQAALAHLSTKGARRPWLRRLGPPQLEKRWELLLVGHTAAVRQLAFSPDGAVLASASDDRTVRVWDASTGRALHTFAGHTERVAICRFAPNGAWLLSASDDGTIRLWDWRNGLCVARLAGHTEGVTGVTVSPDGSRIASGSTYGDSSVRLWEGLTGTLIAELSGLDGGVDSIAFSPSGSHVAAGSVEGRLRIWNAQTGEPVADLAGHGGSVTSVAFSSDGRQLLSSSLDGSVRLWDIHTGRSRVLCSVELGRYDQVSVAFLPSDTHVILSWARHVEIRQVSTGEVIWSVGGNWFALERDTQLLIGRWDQPLRRFFVDVLDLDTKRAIATYEASGATAVSPDRTHLADPLDGGTIRIRRNEPAPAEAAALSIQDCRFSPSGSLSVTSTGIEAVIRDGHSGAVLSQIAAAGPAGAMDRVVFIDDTLLLGSTTGHPPVLTLWSLPAGVQASVLDQFKPYAKIAASPDRRHIAGQPSNRELALWDLRTNSMAWKIVFAAGVEWIAFTADGARIVVLTTPVMAEGRFAPALIAVEVATGRFLWMQMLKESGGRMWDVSPVGAHILAHIGTTNSASDAGSQLVVLDAETGRPIAQLGEPGAFIDQCRFSADGSWVIGIETNADSTDLFDWETDRYVYKEQSRSTHKVRLWDASSGAALTLLQAHHRGATALAFSPRGRYLAIASNEGTLHHAMGTRLDVWDLETAKPRWELFPAAQITSLDWCPDEERLLAGSVKGDVHLLRLEFGVEDTR